MAYSETGLLDSCEIRNTGDDTAKFESKKGRYNVTRGIHRQGKFGLLV